MSDDDNDAHLSRTARQPVRQRRPGEPLWTIRVNNVAYWAELKFHGEGYGWEGTVFRETDFRIGRRFLLRKGDRLGGVGEWQDSRKATTMLACLYARKSTEQTGVADEQKSVARQIEHARQYAERKGWTVADEHVYVDDGICGAEFANRPGFLRLMNALKPRPPFQVLVMSRGITARTRSDRDGVRAEAARARPASGCSSTSKTASGRSTLRPTRSCCR